MQLKNIRPTESRILIERVPEQEYKTEAGIVLIPGLTFEAAPNESIKQIKSVEVEKEPDLYKAEVKACGPDVKVIRVGDFVLVGKYAGMDLFKDRTTIILTEHEVIAIVD